MGQDESQENDGKMKEEEEYDDYITYDKLDHVYDEVYLENKENKEKLAKEVEVMKEKECPKECPTKVDIRYSQIKCIHMLA